MNTNGWTVIHDDPIRDYYYRDFQAYADTITSYLSTGSTSSFANTIRIDRNPSRSFEFTLNTGTYNRFNELFSTGVLGNWVIDTEDDELEESKELDAFLNELVIKSE